MKKKILIVLCVCLLTMALLANVDNRAYAASSQIPYTEQEIQQLVSLIKRAPKDDEFLATPLPGKVNNNEKSIYGFSGPKADAAQTFTIADGEKLTVVAYYKGNDRYCVIVNSRNQACWVNAARISLLSAETEGFSVKSETQSSSQVPYTEQEIQQLVSLLKRAPKDDEFLATPLPGKVNNNEKSIYGFSGPNGDAAQTFTIADGEKLTVVAYYKGNDRYCVIVNSRNQACWVNAARISLSMG